MNNTISNLYLDNKMAGQLQATSGLAVAIGSFLVASASLAHLLYWESLPLVSAVANPGVWLTAIWVPIGLWTARDTTGIGRLLQTLILFVIAMLNAATAAPGELTALLFLGLAMGMSVSYGYATGRRQWLIVPVTLFVLVAVFRQTTARSSPILPLINWTITAAVVLTLIYSLIRTALQAQENQKAILRQKIDEQTADLRRSLGQSEELRKRNQVLLREIHHRTRNNLQLVASLLSLQRMSAGQGDIDAEDVLETAERRVRAMANIQEQLHQSDSESAVPIDEFLKRLTDEFTQTGQVSTVHMDIDNTAHVKVALDFAVPCGLVVNELITNSLKHGYDLHAERPVRIRIREIDGKLAITVEDNGKGVPDHVSLENPTTTGLRIVTGLVQQLDGTIELSRSPNTKWTVEVPLPLIE